MKFHSKLRSIIVVLLLIIITADCASFYHDKSMNPCSPGGSQNGTECDNWKKKYPREYRLYQKRMGKQPICSNE